MRSSILDANAKKGQRAQTGWPNTALPNVKNIASYDYQNSSARACPVAFFEGYGGYLQVGP